MDQDKLAVAQKKLAEAEQAVQAARRHVEELEKKEDRISPNVVNRVRETLSAALDGQSIDYDVEELLKERRDIGLNRPYVPPCDFFVDTHGFVYVRIYQKRRFDQGLYAVIVNR